MTGRFGRGSRIVAAAAVLSAAAPDALPAQADSATVVAGPEYAAGPLYRRLLGSRYRELWTAPIRVPVLPLREYAGGLTPIGRGGSRQTRSLHLEAADGGEYRFRSTNKDQKRGLGRLERWLTGWFRQDQISSLHPAAALIASGLLDAAGVAHPQPHLFIAPDDPALGPYRPEFAGMVGTLEVHPDEGGGDTPGFAGSRKIVGTDGLGEQLRDNPGTRIAAQPYLRARLMDVYLGDWDRHSGQWRWALLGDRWVAIPEDRDYAFVHYDGWLPALARLYDPKLVRFDADYGDLKGLLVTGRPLDRAILCGVPREVWSATARRLRQRITDQAIDESLGRLPAAYRTRSEEMRNLLRARRDNLPDAAMGFHEILEKESCRK